MAYGNVVSYEPGPQPGSYAFQQANGSKFLAFGESAEDLRSRVDASAQNLASVQGNADITPQAVAANDPPSTALPASYEAESAANQAYAAGANSSSVSDAGGASAGGMSGGGSPEAQALAKQQVAGLLSAPAAKPATAAPAESPEQGTLVVRDPKTHQLIYSEPGANPGDPRHTFAMGEAAPATKAGFAPSSMKVEGANAAATPGDLQHVRENEADQREAYKLSYDLHAQSLAEQRAAIDAQQSSLAVAQREQQERQQQMQAKADQLAQVYDAAKNDYANTRIDPERYQRGAVGIGNALAMGLGAYGAAITKSPNFAANLITQQTNNDIARQEAEMRIKGSAAQTALGDLNRQLGSLELAKTAYQGIQLQRAKGQLDLLANSTGTRDAAANYLQGSAQLDAALQANDLAFRQQALGHVTTDFRYHAASGGSRGGQQPLTIEQARELKGIFPAQKGGAKKEEAEHAQTMALKGNDQVARAAGFVLNPETDQWEEGEHTLGAWDKIVGTLGGETEQHKNMIAAMKDYVPRKAHALGERPPPLAQIEDSIHGQVSGRTAETLRAHLNQDRQALRAGATVAPAAAEREPDE